MSNPTITVSPFHFHDFSGTDFERLAFAFHVRTEPTYRFEWTGQAGKDMGRDIIGLGQTPETGRGALLVACANWKGYTAAKAAGDLDACLKSPHGTPSAARFVTGDDTVSSGIRDKVRSHCRSKGVGRCEIWSGQEFEEHIRAGAESLLRRFVGGEVFPDAATELAQFARQVPPKNDREVLAMLSKAFDRPAFQDPIWKESSLPAFRQAIEDSICVLNTGAWKTRDGAVMAMLPSKNEVGGTSTRGYLDLAVTHLRELRTAFDDGLRDGSIKACGCGKPECPVFQIDDCAALRLEAARRLALDAFRKAYDGAQCD